MQKHIDKLALAFLGGIGIFLFPFWVRKPPLKDWTIIFLLAGFLSGMLDLFITAHKLVGYPVQIFGKKINISLLFDYLLFPTLGVLYNQSTYRSKLWGIIWKALGFSIPMTLFEYWLDGHTQLVKWKQWKWYYTLITITLVFLLERGFIALVRRFSDYFQAEERNIKSELKTLIKKRIPS